MKLAEEKPEEITITVSDLCSGQQEAVEISIDCNLGEFRREAQKVFGIPENRATLLMLEKSCKIMSDDDTFQSADIHNNVVLLLVPNIGDNNY